MKPQSRNATLSHCMCVCVCVGVIEPLALSNCMLWLETGSFSACKNVEI